MTDRPGTVEMTVDASLAPANRVVLFGSFTEYGADEPADAGYVALTPDAARAVAAVLRMVVRVPHAVAEVTETADGLVKAADMIDGQTEH